MGAGQSGSCETGEDWASEEVNGREASHCEPYRMIWAGSVRSRAMAARSALRNPARGSLAAAQRRADGHRSAKAVTGDVLLTYLIHPGAPLYLGYTQLGTLR